MSNYDIKKVKRGRGHHYEFLDPPLGKVDGATTVARAIVDKSGPLSHYHARQTIEGLRGLRERFPHEPLLTLDTDALYELLRRERLSLNHLLQKAGDRGTSVHSVLEVCIESGTKPDPSKSHPADRGYVEAVAKLLAEHRFDDWQLEQVVGSAEYGFAGTLDYRGFLDDDLVLLDWKTSKRTYIEHHIQLGLYELASQEMGYPVTEAQYLVHLRPNGTYELVEVRADLDTVRAALEWYAALKRLEGATKVGAGIA